MPRTIAFEVPVETSLFAPEQLQPRSALTLSFTGLAHWLRDHLVSYPKLLHDWSCGVVFLGFGVHYEEPLGFFDADVLHVSTGMKLVRDGKRLTLDTEIRALDRTAVRVGMLLCPVRVVEPTSLAAEPGPLPEQLQAKFHDDERVAAAPTRTVPALVAELERTGRVLGEGQTSFIVSRHLCEVADQWYFAEIPRLVGPAREALALAHVPALEPLLTRPMQRMDVELTRPYYWLQQGEVRSVAYLTASGTIAVVHRLFTTDPVREPNGTVVEQFACS